MVLIERFRLNGGDLIECAPWVSPSLLGPPAQRLEPLRYKVAKVHAHALELLVDDRTTYHQFGRTTSQGPPHPAPALAAPPLACVFPGFTYEIRVADDQWLVSSSSRGYQHWWSSIDGSCQADERLGKETNSRNTNFMVNRGARSKKQVAIGCAIFIVANLHAQPRQIRWLLLQYPYCFFHVH